MAYFPQYVRHARSIINPPLAELVDLERERAKMRLSYALGKLPIGRPPLAYCVDCNWQGRRIDYTAHRRVSHG